MFSRRFLLTLIIPLVIEQFLAVTIGMADTVMVATAGEASVSAISLVDAITILLVTLFSAFATGGAVVSSQYLGRRDHAAANNAAKQLLMLSIVVSVVMMAVCIPIRRKIIQLIFGAIEEDVLSYGSTYFFFILASIPFLATYNSASALFRSMGHSKVNLGVSVIMNFINVAGNAYLIYGRGLGVTGAGLATLTSRIIGSIIILLLLANRKNAICVRNYLHFEWNPEMIKRILRIGIPNGIEGSVFQIGKLLVQGFLTVFGTATLAANAIAGSITSFINIPGGAIGLATITIIGQAVGAKRYDQAVYYGKRLLLVTYITMTAIAIPAFFLMSPIVAIFGLSPEATVMADNVLKTAMIVMVVCWPTAFTMPNFLRATGDAKYTMLISMFSMWFFRVAMSYLLAKTLGWGIYGVWIGMYIDWLCRSVCYVTRFLKGKWKTKRVI